MYNSTSDCLKMKFLVATILSLAVASGFTQPLNEEDRVKDLIDAAVAYARSQVKTEPFTLGDEHNVRMFGFFMTATNINLKGLSHATFDHEETDPKALTGKLRASVPKVTFEFNYQMHGEPYSYPVSGDGTFRVVGTNVSFDATRVEFSDDVYEFIQNLNGVFNIDDLSVEMGVLDIAGKKIPDLGKLIEYLFKFFYHLYTDEMSAELSRDLRNGFNRLVEGHSMEDATQWLKNHTK